VVAQCQEANRLSVATDLFGGLNLLDLANRQNLFPDAK
jgi:hypothetical protein